ncbi:hypothetical protein Fmac_002495 [Flemingia macrophylla]|uniref:Transposase n=1 Tax=Flemingia macrophylla TaxID=520843 RepID=A0ABD1NK29_9FABA
MSDEEKDVFFQRSKRKVTWRPEHEDKIIKNFNSKASHRLSEMFLEARKNGKKPSWMFDRVWNSLLVKWNEPEFRSKSAQAQKNRASEKCGSLHIGGSITIHEHVLRMAQELGRAVHVDEVFHQTHVRKTTGDFVDQRSKKTYEDFQSIYSQARSEAASCGGGSQSSPIDSVQEEIIRKESWFTTTGGKNSKGKVYGVGKVSQGYRLGDRLPETWPWYS